MLNAMIVSCRDGSIVAEWSATSAVELFTRFVNAYKFGSAHECIIVDEKGNGVACVLS